jgi:hypothetical protein
MHKLAYAILLAFTVTLAATIGLRMSAEAMAVAIGVIFGIAAGLPTSLLLASFARRDEPVRARTTVVREAPREVGPPFQPQQAQPQPQQPPIIVVTPSANAPSLWPPYGMNMPPSIPPPQANPHRGPRVVGDAAEEEGGW